MSDHLKGCTVAFTESLRDDDAEQILNAIALLRGVACVTPSLETPVDWMVEQRVRIEFQHRLHEALAEKGL